MYTELKDDVKEIIGLLKDILIELKKSNESKLNVYVPYVAPPAPIFDDSRYKITCDTGTAVATWNDKKKSLES